MCVCSVREYCGNNPRRPSVWMVPPEPKPVGCPHILFFPSLSLSITPPHSSPPHYWFQLCHSDRDRLNDKKGARARNTECLLISDRHSSSPSRTKSTFQSLKYVKTTKELNIVLKSKYWTSIQVFCTTLFEKVWSFSHILYILNVNFLGMISMLTLRTCQH